MCEFLKDLPIGSEPKKIFLYTKGVKEKQTSGGKPYLEIEAMDPSGEIDSIKLWDRSLSYLRGEEKNLPCVWEYTLSVTETESKGGVKYKNYVFAKDPSDPTKLLPWGPTRAARAVPVSKFRVEAPEDAEAMYQEIMDKAESFREPLKGIVTGIYQECRQEILKSAAAKKLHHAFYGGLLYHTIQMMRMGELYCQGHEGIDVDLLLAGIILHDIGKLKELETDDLGATTFTDPGSLLGHISLGHSMLVKFMCRNGIEECEDTMLLEHMILSHHGRLEWGSPVLPKTREAHLLHHIDYLDSQDAQIARALESAEPGISYPLGGSLKDNALYKRG